MRDKIFLAAILVPRKQDVPSGLLGASHREAPVRLSLVTVWAGFSVPAVPLQKGSFCVFQFSLTGKDGSSSGFGCWKMVLAVPVRNRSAVGFGKNGSYGSDFQFRFGSYPA